MILYLFGSYFNPLTITNLRQVETTVVICFSSGELITVDYAKVYDVASIINEAIKEFNK
jgi:hypothetical protein